MSMFKRILSAFLAMVLAFGMIPTTAFATEEDHAASTIQETTEILETEPEATEPEATEPEATEPEATEPEATEPEATEPEATEPEATEPEATEPEATEPEATEPEATEPEATEPEATEPEATEPEVTEPEATEPEATEPEETEPEETEPEEELERVPLEPVFHDWFLKENTVTKTETITVVEQVDADVFKTREVTEEKSFTTLELEEIFNYPMAPMAMRGEEIPTTFESFAELKAILREDYAGDLVLTYKGSDVLEITEDFTIPENVTILTDNSEDVWESAWYEYEGTEHLSVFVPAGVELTVNGSLQVAGLRLEGDLNVNGFVIVIRGIHIPFQCGAIVRLNRRNLYLAPNCCYDVDLTNKIDVNNDGSSVYYWHDVIRTKDEFVAEMRAINDNPGGFPHRVLVEQEEHFLLDEDVVIAEKVLLPISDKNGFNVAEPGSDYGITVAEGCTLTINSDWVVDLGVPMQIDGTLEVNGSSVYANSKIHFTETGKFTGNGNLYISKGNVTSWDQIVTGLDPDKYQGLEVYGQHYWLLQQVEGKTRLSAPMNLAWHKKVWDWNVVEQKGNMYWEAGDLDSTNYLVRLYNAKTNEVIRTIEYGYGSHDGTRQRSLPQFLLHDMPSGSYYFTVTVIPQPEWHNNPIYTADDYYASQTVVSPVWKYTKPGKTLGVPGNLTTSYPLVTWNTPANGTKNTMYEVVYFFTPSLDQPPYEVGYSNLFTGNYNQMWPGITQNNGKGYYSFAVRAITEDVTKKNTGSWSEPSVPYFYDPEDEATYADESFFQANVDQSTGYIYVDQKVILKDDYNIPESTYLNIVDGGSVVVPAGVTLTVSGGLYLRDGRLIVMPGGTLNLKCYANIDYDGELNIVDADQEGGANINFGEGSWVSQQYYNGEFTDCTITGIPEDRREIQIIIDRDADSDQRDRALELFRSHPEHGFAQANFSIQTDMELPDGFVIPKTGLLHVESYGKPVNVTIPEGANITIDGEFYVWQNCNLDNRGTIYSNRCLQIFGSMYNTGMIQLRTPIGAELEAILGVQAYASVHNAGTVRQYYGAFVYRDKNSRWTGNPVEDVFAAFKKDVAAAAKNGTMVEVTDTIVIGENYTIPSNVYLRVRGGTIIVPNGMTLTMNNWTDVQNGTIIVEEGGKLALKNGIELYGEDTIQVDGTLTTSGEGRIYRCLNHEVPQNMPFTVSGVETDLVWQRIFLTGDMDVGTALDAFENFDRDKFGCSVLLIRKDVEVTRNLTIPADGILHVEWGSTLTIGSGYTLHNYGAVYVWNGNTLNNCGTIENRADLNVYGTLNNDGVIRNEWDDDTVWMPCFWVSEEGTVYNNNEVWLYEDTELTVDGNWYGNAPMNRGGAIYGSGKFNGGKLMMTEKQLLDALKKTSGWSYDMDQVVRFTSKSVTLTKQVNILPGAALYVPKGTTLTVKGDLYVCDGGSIIVEEGGKLVNNSLITVRSETDCGGIFRVDGTYSQGDYSELRVLKYNTEEGADVIGVDTSYQTVYLENADLDLFKWAMERARDDYAGAWVETDNLHIPSGEEIIVPWNSTVVINPTWDDQQRYTDGEDMWDWVTNDGTLIVYGHVWVNSLLYDMADVSVPANFRNNGYIEVSEGGWMTFSGNVENNGTIFAGVAGWLETWSDFGRTWSGNAPVFMGGASDYSYATAGDEAWAMSQQEFKKLLSNKKVSEIYLDRHVVLFENTTLNKPVIVGPNGGLIVDGGATVTNKSELIVENGGDLVVYGSSKLVNQGYIQLDTHEDQNGIFCCYGTFSGNPVWAMLNDGEPNIVTDSKHFMMASFWDTNTDYSLTDVLAMDLKAYDGVQYHLTGDENNPLILDGSDTLVIPHGFSISLSPFASLTLDQNVDLYGSIYLDRFAENTSIASVLTINEGKSLTIRNGSALDGNGDVDNFGSVIRYYSGYIDSRIRWNSNPVDEMGTMSFNKLKEDMKYYEKMQMETGESEWFDYQLDEVVTLGGNFTAYSPIIHLTENGHIIVPKGKTLTVQGLYVEGGRITVQKGGTLQVKGKLDIMDSPSGVDGIVTIEPGATLKNSGNITIGGMMLNEDETDYVSMGGGSLRCYGSYKPTGIHYLFRDDVSYDEWFEPRFTGSVMGISNAYQVLPNINIDTGSAEDNGDHLAYVIDNLHGWYGYMGTQISVSDVVLPYSLTLPDRFELYIHHAVIPENITLTVNGLFSADYIENNGTLILGKNAETSLANGSIVGNAPVFKGAYIGPETSGITVEAVDPEMTVVSGSKVTIQGSDAVYCDENGNSEVKLRVNVKPAKYYEWEDLPPLEYVTFGSSNKKVLDPAKIVRNEDGTYTLNGLGVGTAKLTITSMATKQGSASRSGAGGKLTGKQVSTTVTITVTPVKAAKVVLNESRKIFDKSEDLQTFTLSADILDARDRVMSGKSIVWSTSDKKLATIKDTGNGTALVTVQKNVDGIALITAQVKDQKDITATVDVVIQDPTPRLGSSKFNVNPYVVAGTSVDLIESYGNTIRSVAVDNTALKAEYSDGKLTVTAREHTLKKQTLKNVMLHVFTDAGEYNFKLTVNVAPAYPKITVKQAAKLDLFYNGSEKELTVTAKDAEVIGIRMDGSVDFGFDQERNMLSFSEKLKTEYPGNNKYKLDSTVNLYIQLKGYHGEVLVKNFKIGTTTSKKTFQIMSDVDGKLKNPVKLQRFLEKELLLGVYEKSGKTLTLAPVDSITTTNAKIYDEGEYKDLWKSGQFFIGCDENTKSRKVTLVLDREDWMRPQKVTFQFNIDNAKPTVKPKAGTLTMNSVLARSAMTEVSTTMLSWEELQIEFGPFTAAKPNKETDKISVWYEDGCIFAEINEGETPKKGTYAFKATPTAVNVDDNRLELGAVTVNVKIVTDKPVVKLTKSTLTLNSLFTVKTDMSEYTVSMVDHDDVGFGDFVAVNPNAETAKLSVQYQDGVIEARIQENEIPKNGTYSFKTTPYVYNQDGEQVNLSSVTVKVKVENTKPTVKLKTTSVKLNTNLAGSEFTEIPVTFTNKTGYEGLSFDRFKIEEKYEDKVFLENVYYVDEDYSTLKVQLKDGAPKGTYKINLYPQVDVEYNGSVLELGKITLEVKAYTSNVKISTKTSGKLDTLNMDSYLRYSITKVGNALGIGGSNLAQVGNVELAEDIYDNNLFQIPDGIQTDASGKPYFDVKLRDDVTYDLKKTYKIQATYTVWDKPVVVNYSFKVSQTALKAKVVAPGTFYQSAGKSLNIKLELTAPDFAYIQRIEFNKAKSSKELAAALGFTGNKWLFVNEDGTVQATELDLDFVKFGNLKNGATYNLVLNVYPGHHAKNANPLQVTIKVKIIK